MKTLIIGLDGVPRRLLERLASEGMMPTFARLIREGFLHSLAASIEDNTRSWSGDHCVDPSLVPGVFFSNLPPQSSKASLADLAPTVLYLFGVAAPSSMKGMAIFRRQMAG